MLISHWIGYGIFKTVVFVTPIKKPETIISKVNHLELVSAFVSKDEELPRTWVHLPATRIINESSCFLKSTGFR